MKKAFTLVELLIVIAILSILGVGLLVALDPLEQTRRAQDTTIQQSAIELKSALNRYFASKLIFPWCSTSSAAGTCTYLGTNGCTADANSNVGASGTCANYTMAQLLATGELKSSPPANVLNALNIVTSSSGLGFSVSFQPSSKAFDSNLTNLFSDNLCVTAGTTTTCATGGNNCYYCVK